jgi:hypothetical protein
MNLIIALASIILTPALSHAECFERYYQKDHLKKYPGQELRTASFSYSSQYDSVSQSSVDAFSLNIHLVKEKKVVVADISGTCDKNIYSVIYQNEKATCKATKDGSGTFVLSKTNDPKLLLQATVSDNFQFVDVLTKKSLQIKKDDRVFRLEQDAILQFDTCENVLAQPQTLSPSRLWNEVLLQSIRYDLARPTVTARNLYHFSVLMWDIYASFDSKLKPLFLKQNVVLPTNMDIPKAREQALNAAAYTFIKERYKNAPGNVKDNRPFGDADSGDGSPDQLINRMLDKINYKLDPEIFLKDNQKSLFDARAYGTSMANEFLIKNKNDGSREELNYATDKSYVLKNNMGYLDVMQSGVHTPSESVEIKNEDGIVVDYVTKEGKEFANAYDIDYWLPMFVPGSLDQNGNELDSPQMALTPFWGSLPTFSDLSAYKSQDKEGVYFEDEKLLMYKDNPEEFIKQTLKVMEYSSQLSPVDLIAEQKDFDRDGEFDKNIGAELIDISPYSMGNNSLGSNDGKGYKINPITGQPYKQTLVKRADYFRGLAEFWADGPTSETPPGHWNVMTNSVVDKLVANGTPLRWQGKGNTLAREEYELKVYVAVNGALHDAGIVAWGLKGYYQGSRPVAVLRKLAKMAENDPVFAEKLVSLSPHLKMVTYEKIKNRGELDESSETVTKLAIYAWRGPANFGEILDLRDYSFSFRDELATEEHTFYFPYNTAGVGWILAENWLPFQRQTFVTPPFPGFISGHSTFSRAAAEVLTSVTGSEYFPGGYGSYPAPDLLFEQLDQHFEFQWAKYTDASDQSALSRLYGGIHASYDDFPGRRIGSKIGKAAAQKANELFEKQ